MQGREPVSPGRVLLVDDEPVLVRTFCRALERLGMDVVTAEDGSEAVRRLTESEFDVVVSDISMPTMDGLELLRSVREHDVDLPVVLMTGSPQLQSAAQAIQLGVLGYLIKPVSLSDMRALIERAVGVYRLAKIRREALAYLTGPGAGDWVGDRANLEAQFRAALETLWMAYQPIVSLSERRIVAYEALVRPTHPAMPNPPALIRAAEQLRRLHELGRHLRDIAACGVAGSAAPGPNLFVNLHASDLADEALLDPEAPLSLIADRVVLEITERASLVGVKDLGERIQRLRQRGFRIAIDDLGAGYSGLALFAQLQPDVIKIDMSLVRDIDREPTKRRLVSSMLSLCRDLRIEVVCEGVETPAERDTLVALGADLFQGYLFARPGPAFPSVTF